MQSNLRTANKQRRRDAILDAAIELIRDRGVSAVTSERIAARANVAPATLYNLIGPREELLRQLVGRSLDAVDEELGCLPIRPEPIAAARTMVDRWVIGFVAESVVLRQVVLLTSPADDDGRRARRDRTMTAAIIEAQADRVIRSDVAAESVAQQILMSFDGAMLRWCRGALSDSGFELSARHGLISALAAATTHTHRWQFSDELVELGEQLTAPGTRA
jgi:AcrR family transcriptional regulator